MNKSFIQKNQAKNLSTQKESILSRLWNFSETMQYHCYSPGLFPHFLLSDGVHYLAESCGAYWLMDLLASYQQHDKIKSHRKLQHYQFWSLAVNRGAGVLRCDWYEGETVLEESINVTDFPLNAIRIWVCSHGPVMESGQIKKHYKVAMLPQEY